MIVVFDSNIWLSDLGLRTSAGSAVRFYLKNAAARVAIPEVVRLEVERIAVSSGSACTSASLEPGYEFRALGRSDELAHSSLRITIGRFTTDQEVDFAVATLRGCVRKLRDLSPLWEMFQDGVDLSTLQWSSH